MCTEDSFGPAPIEGGVQAEEIKRLTGELDRARQVVLEKSTDLSRAQSLIREAQRTLQAGLLEMDRDDAEPICEFLNDYTPWEFTLDRSYRVEVTCWVVVTASNEDDAREFAENSISVHTGDADEELESTDVRDCEVVED